MAAGDHASLIEACARLGDVSRGGDPHLWTEVLQYFGSQQYDCSAQVSHLFCVNITATEADLVYLLIFALYTIQYRSSAHFVCS